MSFIISIYTHEGVIMSADSRLTLNTKVGPPEAQKDISFDFSNATYKIFKTRKGIGISAAGDASIAGSPIAGYIEKFVADNDELDIDEFAPSMLTHFRELEPSLASAFHIAGYNKDQQQRLYIVKTKLNTAKQVIPDKGQGAQWSGETDIVNRIINATWLGDKHGKPAELLPSFPIPWQFFSLQDAIDFAVFAMQATIGALRFQNRIKTVGGPIDVLAIKPDEAFWVQRKKLYLNTNA